MDSKPNTQSGNGFTRKRNMSIVVLVASLYLGGLPSYAGSTSGGWTELKAAIVAAGANDFTVTENIIPDANLGAMTGTELTIYGGTNYDLDAGGVYSGITVAAGKTINISNFGSLNGDGTVSTAIKNFKSLSSGSFIHSTSSLSLNMTSNVFYNNVVAGSTTVLGGVVDSTMNITNATPVSVVFEGNTFSHNSATATRNSSGGSIYQKVSLANAGASDSTTIKHNTFISNEILSYDNSIYTGGHNGTAAYGGAIYKTALVSNNSVTAAGTSLTVENNIFDGNKASAISCPVAPSGTVTVMAMGGAIYNDLTAAATRNSTANIYNYNYNEFKKSLASAVAENNVAFVDGSASLGDRIVTAAAGAIYNKITLASVAAVSDVKTNIKGNIFGTNSTDGNTAIATTSATSTNTSRPYAYAYGGAIYNWVSITGTNTATTNIGRTSVGDTVAEDNIFAYNKAEASDSCKVGSGPTVATAAGGAIYNEITVLIEAINKTNINYNKFLNNLAVATISTITTNSSTAATATAVGGAIFNVTTSQTGTSSNTININSDIFKSNEAKAINSSAVTSSTGTTVAYAYGGALYNKATVTGTTATYGLSISDNIFGGDNLADGNIATAINSSKATSGSETAAAYGGSVYNEISDATTDAKTETISFNYNEFKNSQTKASIENNSTVTTTSGAKTAVATGGALYNKITFSGANATATINIKGSTFGDASTNGNSVKAEVNNTANTVSITTATAQGGAILNSLSQAAGSSVTTNIGRALDGDPSADDNIFAYNKAESTNSSTTTTGATVATAYGGAIYNEASVLLTAIGTTNIKFNTFANNSALATNSSNTSCTAVSATAGAAGSTVAEVAGGAIYNVVTSQTGTSSNIININKNVLTSNSATATNSSTELSSGTTNSYAYGGTIYNKVTVSGATVLTYSLSISDNIFGGDDVSDGNILTSINSSDAGGIENAYAYGGALYNELAISTSAVNTVTMSLNSNIFKNNKAKASIENSSTAIIGGRDKNANAFGGAIYNKVDMTTIAASNLSAVTNVKGSTFGDAATNGNSVVAEINNTDSTTYATAALANGGAIYSNLKLGAADSALTNIGRTDIGDTDTSDTNFAYNKAIANNNGVTTAAATSSTAKGGAVYQEISLANTGASEATNIKYSDFTTSEAIATNNSKPASGAPDATAQGGAIYKIATVTAATVAGTSLAVENGIFDGNKASAINSSLAPSGAVTANAIGGAIYNELTAAVGRASTSNIYNYNYNEFKNSLASAVIQNNADFVQGVSVSSGNKTANATAGAIYNNISLQNASVQSATINIKGNVFGSNAGDSNKAVSTISSVSTGAGTTSANAYGGAIYNTINLERIVATTVNIGRTDIGDTSAADNSFAYNKAEAINTSTTATGTTSALAQGGAIYNMSYSRCTNPSDVNIKYNTFSNNSAVATNSSTTSNATTASTGATSQGGAIYNFLFALNGSNLHEKPVLNAEYLSFKGNIASAENSSTSNSTGSTSAAAYGGAIFNKMVNLYTGMMTTETNIKNSIFGGDTLAEGNKAIAINSSTVTTGDTYAYAYGGAIGNLLQAIGENWNANILNIENTIFKNNSAVALNTSNATNKIAIGYGGAVYNNFLANKNASISTNIINITDTLFESNSATLGGAMYSNIVQQSNGANTNTLKIKGTTDTASNFKNNTAESGGAIYNYASTPTAVTANAYFDFDIEKTTFEGNSATTGKGGAMVNKFSTTLLGIFNSSMDITSGTKFSGNFGVGTTDARGGAIYNELSTDATTTTSTAANSSISLPITIDNSTLENNYVSTSTDGSSTAYGGAIFNSSLTNASLSSTGTATATTTFSNSMTSGAVISGNHATSQSTGSNITNMADARGGAIYNDFASTAQGLSASAVVATSTATVFNAIPDTIQNNYASATAEATANAYGGAIYNKFVTTANAAPSIATAGIAESNILSSSTLFSANYATALSTGSDATLSANAAGGAIYNYLTATATSSSTRQATATSTLETMPGTVGGDFDGNYALATAETTANAYGGAIYSNANAIATEAVANKSTASANLTTSLLGSTFSNNYAKAITTGSDSANALGGAIYNIASAFTKGTAKAELYIDNGSIFDGNYASATSANIAYAKGGAIYNAMDYLSTGVATAPMTIVNSLFKDNYVISTATDAVNPLGAVANGGAIYNCAKANVTGSTFEGNSALAVSTAWADGFGGAIYNDFGGAMTITNSAFTNNNATTAGGAIYNSGQLFIVDTAGTTTFSGNTAAGVSNALHLASGTAYLNTSNVGVITFNDKITSSAIGNIIEINKFSLGLPIDGTVVFNDTVSDATINVNNGTLKLGTAGSTLTNTYLSNVNLNLNISNLDLQNDLATDVVNLNDFNATSGRLFFDANLATGENDKINVAGVASGDLYITNLKILADADATSLTLVTGDNISGLTLKNFTAFTNFFKYDFTGSTNGTYSIVKDWANGLNSAVAFDEADTRSFSATADSVCINELGPMGRAGSELNVFGNGYDISGGGHGGVSVASGQTLNVENVGSWHTFGAFNGGVIHNEGTTTIVDSKFGINRSDHGGDIYNSGVLTVSNSLFEGAEVNVAGGAIYNTGVMTVTDSSFLNNNAMLDFVDGATRQGGAIYNSGTANIVSSTRDVLFLGNYDSSGSNALYLDSGSSVLNLNSAEYKKLTFNDKITSSDIANIININKTDLGLVSGGNVVFNNTVSDATVNLYGGTLTLGNTGSSLTNTYLSNVDLNLNAGVLNMKNNLATDVIDLNNFNANSLVSLNFDANLATGENDKINVAGTATGTLKIGHFNLLTEAPVTSLTLVTGSDISGLTLANFEVYTNSYKYTFTGSTDGTYSIVSDWTNGLNAAVACDTLDSRSFSALADVTVSGALGAMGRANSELYIYGNSHSITGGDYAGVGVASGQKLNVSSADSWTGFKSASGGAINNAGTTVIENSIFENNVATANGGAIYNSGTLYIVDDSSITTFSGNKAGGISNALHLAGGTTYLNASNGGGIVFNDKITSSSIGNVININKTDIGLVSGGTVVFNDTVSDATVNVYGGMLKLGETVSNLTNTYLSNVNLNAENSILNLKNGVTTDVLNLNNFSIDSLSSLEMDANLATGENDKINVSGTATGTVNVNHFNIVADGEVPTLTLVTGSNISGLTLNNFEVFTNFYKYNFTGSTNGTYSIARDWINGLNAAVACDTVDVRTFAATADVTVTGDLGPMGRANSTLYIYGNNHSISGSYPAGVGVAFGQTLNISGVGSVDGSGTVVKSFNTFSSTDGGVVNNSGTLSLSDSVFYSNHANNNGGVLYNSGTATILDSIIQNNNSLQGGSIYNAVGGTAVITGSLFEFDHSSAGGGAIYNAGIATIASSSFEFNYSFGGGGSILNTGTVDINNTTFANNFTIEDAKHGGAIYNSGTLNINNSTFIGNRTSSTNGHGGAIYNDGGEIFIENSNFNGNYTNDNSGGAIYNFGDGNLTVKNSTFLQNATTAGGGGAIHNKFGTLLVEDSVFRENRNTVANYGGAIANGLTATIKNSQFYGNRTPGNGGAITLVDSSFTTISGSTFGGTNAGEANYSTYNMGDTYGGGAIYVETTTAELTIDGTEGTNYFINNYATGGGGAILSKGKSNVSDAEFAGNKAKAGGGIFNWNNTLKLSDTKFTNNEAVNYGGAIANGNSASAITRITDSEFTGNKVTNAATTTGGGAIYNNVGRTTITNTIFNNNSTAGGNGGAILNTGGGIVDVIADNGVTSFTGNTYLGGFSNAIFLDSVGGANNLNLNAGNGGVITFNDRISSPTLTNTININNTGVKGFDGVTDSPTNGTVVLNEYVGNLTINFYDGTLAFGKTASATMNTYMSGVDLNINGGVLDINNGVAKDILNVNNFNFNSSASIKFDANLATGESDRINVYGTATGVLNVNHLNIIADGDFSSLTLVSKQTGANISGLTLNNFHVFTNSYKYDFTGSTNGTYSVVRDWANGLNSAVACIDADVRSFSAVSDVSLTEALGPMGRTNSSLYIYGNNVNIAGGGKGGVAVDVGQTLKIADVASWSGFSSENGGVINNSGETTIENSSFVNNVANNNGGVVHNTGIMTIKNSSFTNNTATNGSGGAIFNEGLLYIIDDSNTTTFSGNKVSGVSNAIHLAGGTTYLNNLATGQIVFNDKISSSSIGNAININKTDLGLASGGTVTFNETVSDATINLYSGALAFGGMGATYTNTYLSNVDLNLNAGILNLENNLVTDVLNLHDFNVNPLSSIKLDANLATGESDKINVDGLASGTLNINHINILADGDATTLTLVTGSNISGLVLNNFEVYTNYFKYDFTGSTNGIYSVARDWSDGLNSAVACDLLDARTFSATADVIITESLGAMGRANSELNIFGNDHSINGNGKEGIAVSAGQKLNIANVTSWSGFNGLDSVIDNAGTTTIANSLITENSAVANGGAIQNSGTITAIDTSFTDNSAGALGGAIYNSGVASIVASSREVLFEGNTDISGSHAVHMDSGSSVLNLNSAADRSVTFNDKISSSGLGNIININKTDLGLVSGGIVNLNQSVSDVTLNLYSGTLALNNAASTSINNCLSNVDLNLSGGTLDMENGLTTDVITLNNFSSTASALLKFDANMASGDSDKINVLGAATGSLGIGHLNIVADGLASTIVLFTGGVSPALSTYEIVTSNYRYTLTSTSAGVYDVVRSSPIVFSGLNYAIQHADTIPTFSATADTNAQANLGTMAGVGSTLTIFGNNYSQNGLDFSGVNVLAGQTLNIYDVGSMNADGSVSKSFNGYSSVNGGVVNNNGTVAVANSVLYNNKANGSGGFLYNKGLATILDSVFKSNRASLDGGAVYNTGDVTVTTSSFSQNNVAGKGGAVYNMGNSTIASSTFVGNSAANGGAIYNTGATKVTNSAFGQNVVSGHGGAIYNTGTATVTNSSFVQNIAAGRGGAIYNSGTMNIIADNGNVAFAGNTDSTGSNAIFLDSGSSVLNLNAGNGGNVILSDKITSSSNSNAININKSGIVGANGTTSAPTNGTVYVNNTISNSSINLYSGTLALANESYINGNNLTLGGGMLNLANGSIGTMALNTLNLAAGTTTNMGIDINLANATADRITATTYNNQGTLNINSVNLMNDKSGNTLVSVVDPALSGFVTSSVGSAWGPIFKYNLNYDSSSGMMSASAVNSGNYTDYNPSILSKNVSALTGTYLQQVNTYTEALGRSEIFMSLPRDDRMLMKYQNKYASAGNEQFVFSPTMLPEARGGLWCKQYTSFENVPLSNGPRVSSIGYGALVGGDTPLTYLGNGYDGYLTAYVGYNGSTQNYGNVGMNQNGGTVGLTGTVYKGNFFAALTGNVGAMLGESNNPYGSDYFNTMVAGLAMKTGYNIEMMRGKLIVQPSLSASYTFANTFDYTTASGVNMTSQPLNAFQIAPGVKFIGNLKNGWQPYLATNMVWNIMDSQKFYANDVQLPMMSVDPYVEYGIGVQRKWGEKFSGFGQSMFRGGGRNGVAFQFGLRYAFGK